MGRVRRFEDLIAWQKARLLTKEIYAVCENGKLAQDGGLKGQMQRAAVSVMSNIAERFERSTPADYHRFLIMAKGSCAELRSQLYVALDVGHLNPDQAEGLHNQAQEVSRIIGGLATAVRRQTPPS